MSQRQPSQCTKTRRENFPTQQEQDPHTMASREDTGGWSVVLMPPTSVQLEVGEAAEILALVQDGESSHGMLCFQG